ncbi:MAG: hypothetical protein HY204_00650 [Nitrospirae bacterium]|nr:hypothetical protein [Nitrospirota bacterium]
MKRLSLKVVNTMVLAGLLVLPMSAWAEELTADQKVDRLWKRSEWIQVGLNALQVQYASDESRGIPDGTGSATLFFRRAEIYAKGTLQEGLSYEVVYDLSTSTDPLRDALMDLKIIPMADLRVGQFRIPFGIEIQTGAKKLYFIDRMLITSPDNEQASSKSVTSIKTGFLQERDRGLRVSGRPLIAPVGLDYAIAIINGSGLNSPDQNNKKDVVGRVALSAMSRATLGGSLYLGRTSESVVDPATNKTVFTGNDLKRYRTGADIEVRPVDALIVRAEYIGGTNGVTVTHADSKFKGYYVLVAYRLPFNIEPAARFERLDPDTKTSGDTITRTTVGVNYYIVGDTKFQINYEFRDDKGNPKVGNIALAQLHVSF